MVSATARSLPPLTRITCTMAPYTDAPVASTTRPDSVASCCIALENGISVAAKTGTAQLNGPGEPEASHAWIVAYAPVEDPKYVVAVMLKGTNAEISASTGGRLAGPIAKAMLDEAFRITPPVPPAEPAPPASTVAP